MCLILFAWKAHPDYELIVAANRDEWRDRSATPAQWWADDSNVLAGRDLKAGGTWMGVTRAGRFAAITNFRDPSDKKSTAPSRGALVADFLQDDRTAEEFIGDLKSHASQYNGFNLLVGAGGSLCGFASRDGSGASVNPGVHGLSNHLLDEPWPKVSRGRIRLQQAIAEPFDIDALFLLLEDRSIAPDDALPCTGVGVEWERTLSPALIVAPGYGTRCSTVLMVGKNGDVVFEERTRGLDGAVTSKVRHAFALHV